VSLTETTSAGSATTTIDSLVVVSPAPATSFAPYSEGFETITIPGNDFFTYNLNGGNAWSVFGSAGHTGSKSLRLNNYTGNKKGTDEFVLPAMNFSNAISLSLHYWLASAQKTASSIDTLKIWSSADCGSTWSLRSSKTGAPLYTVSTLIGLNFIPTAAQWVQQTVPIGIVVGQPDVRFRFTFFHDGANNIYIDDININGTLGTDQININPDEVSIFPNPASDKSSIGLTLIKHSDVTIKVNDVFGNLVYQLNKKDLSQGEYLFDIPLTWAKGIYFVRLNAGDQQVTQKLIVQ
jgi:hypothetical protein